jgi:molybdenum cofactor cytidylyltransferase
VASSDRVFALILAAGESRRLGRPKQLLELADKPLVSHVVESAIAAELDGVVVVIGSHASEVELELREYPVYRVFNPQFALGQGETLAAGVRATPSTVDAVVILLVDMPDVRPEVIRAVVERWRQTHAPAVVAEYGDRWGHPVLFDRGVFAELARLEGDAGGREVLEALGDLVERVPTGIATAPMDIDTEEDWERMQAEWSRPDC